MKRSFRLLAGTIIFLFMLFTGLAMAEPFAPLVNIPDEMLQDGHDQYFNAMTARNSKIPSREEVGFPSYPGSRILFSQMENQTTENGEEVDLPKRIYMGTPDSVEQVVEFYKQNLEGWRYGEFYSTPTFYKKDGKFNPFEDMMTPRIVISPEMRPRKIMPASKTVIDIYYEKSN